MSRAMVGMIVASCTVSEAMTVAKAAAGVQAWRECAQTLARVA
jgi:hypothetical protein